MGSRDVDETFVSDMKIQESLTKVSSRLLIRYAPLILKAPQIDAESEITGHIFGALGMRGRAERGEREEEGRRRGKQ